MSQRVRYVPEKRRAPFPVRGHRPLMPDVSSPVMRLWPESTVVILATGPSLTADDVNRCCGRARVIAVNDAYRLAPWADALYACDHRWWAWHKGVLSFRGQKYSIDLNAHRRWRDITVLQNTGESGLELKPNGLRTGKNSGYQAINLAVHLGARTILLLGYDMRLGPNREVHFFGNHPIATAPGFKNLIPRFATLIAPLMALGIKVINCTPDSALTCFDRLSLDEALTKYGQRMAVE